MEKWIAYMTLVAGVVLACGASAMADVTAFANWNDAVDPAAPTVLEVGWGSSEYHDEGNRACADTNPWYTGPSPGSGYVCNWVSPRGFHHANMQVPQIALAGGKWGGGLDTSPQDDYASMIYLNANTRLEDPNINPPDWTIVGSVYHVFDPEGSIEFFFKPNWDPAGDAMVRDIIDVRVSGAEGDQLWQLQRDDAGIVTSYIRDKDINDLSQTLTGDLINDWNHIALAWDATSVRTYLNGAKAGETVYSGPAPAKVSWPDHLYMFIGGGNNGQGGSAEAMRSADGTYDALVVRDDVFYTGDTITIPTEEIPLASPLPGDRNDDGFVGQADLDIVLAMWGQSGAGITDPRADVNEDDFVGQTDLDYVLADWGQGTPLTAPVPEPLTLSLLALGAAAVLRRRR